MLTKLFEFQQKIDSYFLFFDWEEALFVLKIISVVLSILLIFIIFLLIYKLKKNIAKSLELVSESITSPIPSRRATNKEWQSVLDKIEKQDTDSHKLAVIEADKILDDLLKKIGCVGEDMGDRLKQISPTKLSNLDDVWQAHRVRNRLVHEPNFKLTKVQAKRAIEIYQKALEDLEMI